MGYSIFIINSLSYTSFVYCFFFSNKFDFRRDWLRLLLCSCITVAKIKKGLRMAQGWNIARAPSMKEIDWKKNDKERVPRGWNYRSHKGCMKTLACDAAKLKFREKFFYKVSGFRSCRRAMIWYCSRLWKFSGSSVTRRKPLKSTAISSSHRYTKARLRHGRKIIFSSKIIKWRVKILGYFTLSKSYWIKSY